MVKIFEDMFIRFDRIHECDGQTHRRTDRPTQTDGQRLHDGIASRGKKKHIRTLR